MSGAETFRGSADAYDRFVGRYGAQLAGALIGFAGVEPGMRAAEALPFGDGELAELWRDAGCPSRPPPRRRRRRVRAHRTRVGGGRHRPSLT